MLLATAFLFTGGQAVWGMLALLGILVWEVARGEPLWKRTSIDRPLVILIAVLLLSALRSPWRSIALLAVAEFSVGAFVVLRAVVLSALHRRAFTHCFLVAWAIGGAVGGLLAIVSGLIASDGRAVLPHESASALGTTLAMATVLVLGLSTADRRAQRLSALLSAQVTFVGLALTWSRGAWAAAVVGLTVLVALTPVRRFAARALLPALLIAVVFLYLSPEWRTVGNRIRTTVDTHDPLSRLTIWHVVPRIVADHPVLGTGLNTFVLAYALYAPPPHIPGFPPHAHNLFLNFAAETGVAGLLAFVAFLWTGGLVIWRWYTRSLPGSQDRLNGGIVLALVAVALTHQLVDATLMSSSLAFGLYALFGLSVAEEVRNGT